MSATTHSLLEPNPPGSAGLRRAYLALWLVDAIAATLFFVVPYANELNPVTVYCYHLFGLPGVALAAGCYALVVLAIGHVLSAPTDKWFVGLMVAVYVVLVANNVPLLLFDVSLVELLVA